MRRNGRLIVLSLIGGAVLSAVLLARSRSTWASPQADEYLLFDLDLTQGPPRGARNITIEGGRWDKGWRVVEDENRIVLDARHAIKNGYFEVEVTADRPPYCQKDKTCPADRPMPKMNFIGLYESPKLTQKTGDDTFYLRTGRDDWKYYEVKASGYSFDRSECAHRVGDPSDWIADDKMVHRFRLEWKNGIASVVDRTGRTSVCATDRGAKLPKEKPHGINRPLTVDEIRFAFLGTDHYTGWAPKGMRFLRAKLVSYERPTVKFPLYVSRKTSGTTNAPSSR